MARDAKPQLFTPTIRDYLTGAEVSNEADARTRIKNRIRHTFGDFCLLPHVEPEIRKEIFQFKPVDEGLEPKGMDPEPTGYVVRGDYEKSGSMSELTAGTYNLLRFLYLGYRDNGRRDEFFTLLETAIKLAEADMADIPSDDIEVEVDVRINVDTGFTTES